MGKREVFEALSGLMLVLLVAILSGTIVSTALPTITGVLHGSQSQYTWVVTATLLTATASTPIWGRLADLFNKKTLIQVAIAIFAVGSILTGLAQNMGMLIGFRAVQGIGVGGLQALVQVVMAAMIAPRERGKYNGYLGAVMAGGTIGGPLLGGLIVDTPWLGWRWCFFIGVPIAVLAFAVLQKTLHLPTVRQPNVKIDYLGASLIAAGVSLLLIWITFVTHQFAWISWQTAAMVIPALAILVGAYYVEKAAAQPVVPIDVVKEKTTALAILASLAVGMAMFGGSVFLGQYFQVTRGYSPTKAGLVMLPMMLGLLVASTVVGRLISKTGKIKPYIVVGTFALAAGLFVLSFLSHDTSFWVIALGMVLTGVGVGMTMQNLVLAVQNAVALRDLGAASGAVTFFRSLGGTIGVAVLGAVLANKVVENTRSNLAQAGITVPAGSSTGTLDYKSLPEPIRGIVINSFGDSVGYIFLISTTIAVAGIVAAFLLPRVVLRTTVEKPMAAAADPVDSRPATEAVSSTVDKSTRTVARKAGAATAVHTSVSPGRGGRTPHRGKGSPHRKPGAPARKK